VDLLHAISVAIRRALVRTIVFSTRGLLRLLGKDARTYRNIVYIENSDGVKVIFSCLALSLMALFAGFIISYPGNRKSKRWFIPMGIGLILIMNILRITGMALFSYYSPESLDFYHRYIFTFALHGFILLLWILWVSRYGIREKNKFEDLKI
jgi:exosortase family protein XrtF